VQSHEPAPQQLLLPPPPAKAEGLTDTELTAIIEDIQDELPCYGYRRVTHALRRHGFGVNPKRIARVMRVAGLGSKPRKRFVRTTDSQHGYSIFPNLYRNNIPDHPSRVCVADFTYIRVAAGFCYQPVISVPAAERSSATPCRSGSTRPWRSQLCSLP
jgi:putative transposase